MRENDTGGMHFMKALLSRLNNILLHPRAEWQAIRNETTTYPGIMLRYVCILSIIPPAAAVAGRYIFDRNVPDSVLSSSPLYLLLSNVLWYCMYLVNVIITGVVIAAIIAAAESRWKGVNGMQLAAYSFTPLFVAGFIEVIPHMTWCVHIAILYGIYILYLGMRTLLGVRGMRAALYTAASAMAAAVIVGVTNLFEYLFESFILKRVLF